MFDFLIIISAGLKKPPENTFSTSNVFIFQHISTVQYLHSSRYVQYTTEANAPQCTALHILFLCTNHTLNVQNAKNSAPGYASACKLMGQKTPNGCNYNIHKRDDIVIAMHTA